jgi:hypothetical protein
MLDLDKLVEKSKHRLPADFDYKVYLEINPDLVNINNKNSAILHYLTVGVKQKRKYKFDKLIDVDGNFDENFYISEYPDVRDYYKDEIAIPFNQKMFHHYYHHGKNEGKFKNKIDRDSFFGDFKNINIKQYELVYLKNKLECICFLTTSKEINSERFSEFLNHLLSKTPASKISKKIHFKIIVNNNNFKMDFDISNLKDIFLDVEIVNLNLSEEEDIYINYYDSYTVKKMPKFGLKSGPNIAFFKTIEICKKYNTILLLESDCLFGDNWLERINNYVEHANGFLISGAIYDGNMFVKSNSAMMNHINGGTAFYATGSSVLQNLIKIFSMFLEKQISGGMPHMAYDYALKLFIDHGLDTARESSTRKIWHFIYRNYVPNKLILNYSAKQDSNNHHVNIFKKHNYAILHKKPFDETSKIVYTYYEPLEEMNRDYAQEELINICAKSWKKNGWRLVILNYDVARSHDFYPMYSEIVKKLPSVNLLSYDYHCYMRWLAMSKVGGGIMIDYDVVNLSLMDDSIFNQKTLTTFQGHVPCVVSGTAEQYLDICKAFCKLKDNEKCIVNFNNRPHTSDMIMLSNMKDQFNKLNYVVDYPGTAPLVHCSQKFCTENKKNKLQAMMEITKEVNDEK